MLLLNVYKMASLSRSHEISIHLMLLLNVSRLNSLTIERYFNTSYVVIKHNSEQGSITSVF